MRLADKSNEICELNNKKTINAEHLEAALEVKMLNYAEIRVGSSQ